MGNAAAESSRAKVIPKALIPFRFHTNGFQVDYKVFRIRKKPNIDEEDIYQRYDDSFLELNTRSRIVGDIRKVFTHSALNISTKFTSLKRHYYSRMAFGVFTLVFSLILINVGFKQNNEPRGRLLIVFGAISFILCIITWLVVIFTSQQLKALNTDFCNTCVEILQREKVVTWTANFQHLLFNIKCPYNGHYNEGVVEVAPNPFFKQWQTEKDDFEQLDVNTKNYYDKLPLPPWAVDDNYDYRHNNHSGKYIKPPPAHRIAYGNPKGNYLYQVNEHKILDANKPYHNQVWSNNSKRKNGNKYYSIHDNEHLPLMQVDFNDEKIEEDTNTNDKNKLIDSESGTTEDDSDTYEEKIDINIVNENIDNDNNKINKLSQLMSEMDRDKQDITFENKQKLKMKKNNPYKYLKSKKTKKRTKYNSNKENNANDDEKTSTNNIKKKKKKAKKNKNDKNINKDDNNAKSNVNDSNNKNGKKKNGFLASILPKKLFAPKAYQNDGEIDNQKVVKIHDTIIQQFFIENQEECEGFGEETKLIPDEPDGKQDNNIV